MTEKPKNLAMKQAVAAVGQVLLVVLVYSHLISPYSPPHNTKREYTIRVKENCRDEADAVGQGRLLRIYDDLFELAGVAVAQVRGAAASSSSRSSSSSSTMQQAAGSSRLFLECHRPSPDARRCGA